MIIIEVLSLKKFIDTVSSKHAGLPKKEIEKKVLTWLSKFKCHKNKDVETYLKITALKHYKEDISRTYLIVDVIQGELVLLGYYTLAMKNLKIKGVLNNDKLSKTQKIKHKNNECLSILIGQLGKNDLFSSLINLKEILDFAFSTIKDIMELVGGRIILIECFNSDKLVQLYEDHGFIYLQEENSLSQLMIFNKSS